MSKETLNRDESKALLRKIEDDLIRPLTHHKGFQLWMLFLGLTIVIFCYAYFIQLRDGLGVTAMRDYVSWGAYISNFVFFIAVALVGMLISAVLGLLGIQWIKPITRIAEIIAVSMVLVSGLVVVFDMGRPDRLLNVFLYGRVQSPILWDITVVMTYSAISLVLLLLPIIPDAALLRRKMTNIPKWQRKLYDLLAFNWIGSDEQYRILHKSMRVLMILIVPVALSIHTVTSWLSAMTLRPGWNSTNLGPYYVTGAFVAGASAVIIAMYFFRKNYKLKEYLTDFHFDKMSKLLVLSILVYLYFNINEFFVPAFKMETAEHLNLYSLFQGQFALMFWLVIGGSLVLPTVLLVFSEMRKPLPSMLISIAVLIGSWFKRFIIIIPTQLHPFLPIQNVPENFHTYYPTAIELAIVIGPMFIAIFIGTIIAKLFPIVPIWEIAEQKGVSREVLNEEYK